MSCILDSEHTYNVQFHKKSKQIHGKDILTRGIARVNCKQLVFFFSIVAKIRIFTEFLLLHKILMRKKR